MELPESEKLNIQAFSRVFSDMSESYKLFWFSGLLDIIRDGKSEATFNDIIDHMIVDAWYMVSEYHLNLGPSDTLEKLVLRAQKISGLKTSAQANEINDFLSVCDDPELSGYKRTLTLNVPYRFQAPFMPDFKDRSWNRERNVIDRVNGDPKLIYHFGNGSGMDRTIVIQEAWQAYIGVNQAIIGGWLEYNMIKYLQKRNPSVPGISNKLYPPSERKLDKAKKFWKAVIEYSPIINIYDLGVSTMDTSDVSIDHFVPWSYVAHDELWNLVPTTRSYNSSKSNSLPNWELFFPRLCDIEYSSYEAVWKSDQIHTLFDKCVREHVNSDEAMLKLYGPGIQKPLFSSNLEYFVQPTYVAAKNLGFGEWNYEPT